MKMLDAGYKAARNIRANGRSMTIIDHPRQWEKKEPISNHFSGLRTAKDIPLNKPSSISDSQLIPLI